MIVKQFANIIFYIKRDIFKIDINRKKIKTVHFGLKSGNTYLEHKNTKTKDAWVARHSVTGDWTKPDTASSLAYHLLWNKPSLSASFNDFIKKFNLSKY